MKSEIDLSDVSNCFSSQSIYIFVQKISIAKKKKKKEIIFSRNFILPFILHAMINIAYVESDESTFLEGSARSIASLNHRAARIKKRRKGRRRGEIQEYRIEALDLFLPLETLESRRGEDKLEKQHVPPLFFSRHKFTDGRLGRISWNWKRIRRSGFGSCPINTVRNLCDGGSFPVHSCISNLSFEIYLQMMAIKISIIFCIG